MTGPGQGTGPSVLTTLARRAAPVMAAVLLLAPLLTVTAAAAPDDGARATRPRYDVDVFAKVPDSPGLPEGIAIAPKTGRVYVATNPGGNGPTGAPFGVRSQLLTYSRDGKLVHRQTITGQDRTAAALPAYGLQAAALDGAGRVYVADKAPARILRIDPRTHTQRTYATFPDVPPCSSVEAGVPCSDTVMDLRPFPDYIAFGPGGALYVSDFQQALIWRVPRGGGRPTIAYTDGVVLGGMMGANGIQFRNPTTLYVATSLNTRASGATVGGGRIYALTKRPDGTLTRPRVFYESRAADGPDGFAISRSGRVYLNLFLRNQIVVIGPRGREVTRISGPAVDMPGRIPFDSPASSAFRGDGTLLVTNHAVNTRIARHFAVLDVAVRERGLPLFRPQVP